MKRILILTPDGVGSTLLQRSMCIFGNIHNFYINPHELTNGITFDGDLLVKKYSLNYSQSLTDIINLLEQNKNNIIVRLAHYHLLRRNDSLQELNNFYNYLNNNFIIVSCHRKNILEYAMSWAIRNIKNTKNVYSFKEKYMIHPTNDKFELDCNFIVDKCNQYQNYIYWVNDNFKTHSKFYYEDIEHIDAFISDILECEQELFYKKFHLTLTDFCLLSNKNISELHFISKQKFSSLYNILKFAEMLVKEKKMHNAIPLKMNSFNSKITKCTNFIDVIQSYNNWASHTNLYNTLSQNQLNNLISEDIFSKY